MRKKPSINGKENCATSKGSKKKIVMHQAGCKSLQWLAEMGTAIQVRTGHKGVRDLPIQNLQTSRSSKSQPAFKVQNSTCPLWSSKPQEICTSMKLFEGALNAIEPRIHALPRSTCQWFRQNLMVSKLSNELIPQTCSTSCVFSTVLYCPSLSIF